MKTKQGPRKIPRRDFLRAAGLTVGAAGVAAVAAPAKAAIPAEGTPAKAGYRLTEHVKKYYDSTRNY